MALRNENPVLQFAEWKQDEQYPFLTIGTEVERDGRKEVVLGVLGSKQPSTGVIELGYVDLIVDSEGPLELTGDDLALVTGEILDPTGGILGVSAGGRDVRPRRFENWLSQNYPNPFNPTTTISFSIAKSGHVNLVVFDVTGAVVRNLLSESRRPSQYRVLWDGRNNAGAPVASGVYFYRLKAPGFTSAKKMVLLK